MKLILVFSFILAESALAFERIQLYPGYVTKIHCEGRLLISAVGNDALVRLDALPKELGCGVLLKSLGASGSSNLILETSSGTVSALIEVQAGSKPPKPGELEYEIKGVSP